jgi:propionyl-CoA carboxylase beta chain
LYRKKLAESDNPEKLKKELAVKYREEIANPYVADERGYIDEVIDPAITRKKLISAFEALENKHVSVPSRKHGNIPL